CFLNPYAFFFPIMNNFFFVLFQFVFNQFFNIVLRKVIKIILFVYINKHVIPFNERTKPAFAFTHFQPFICCYWRIGFLFLLNKFHSSFKSYFKKILSLIQGNKFTCKTYVGAKPTRI